MEPLRSYIAKYFFYAIVAIVFIYSIYFVYRSEKKTAVGSDFASFYTASTILKERGGEDLYDAGLQFEVQQKIIKPETQTDMLLPFRNLPFVALIFLPFSYFDLLTAYRIYVIFLILGILALWLFAAKTFKNIKYWTIFYLILFYLPISNNLLKAQISLFLLLIILFEYKMIKKDTYLGAGLLAGLLLIKIQFLTLIPFLFILTKNKKAFLRGFLLSSATLLIISFLITPQFISSYPKFLILSETPQMGSRHFQMFTLSAFFNNITIFSSNPLIGPILSTLIYMLIVFYFYKKKDKHSFDINFSISLFFVIVFSVHALMHELVILLASSLILINEAKKGINIQYKKIALFVLFVYLIPLLNKTVNTSIFSVLYLIMAILILSSNKVIMAKDKKTIN